MSEFCGHPTDVLDNGHLRIEYLTDIGPRIARLFAARSDLSMFAEVPDAGVETPYGRFRFMGGHRLWHAPEASPRTYIPDQSISVQRFADGVRLSAAAEPGTSIAKTMVIELASDHPAALIRHEIRNDGLWEVELAPWALTMFRLTGVAVMPQSSAEPGSSEFAPDRKLMLWPYTRLDDRRLHLADDFILLDGQAAMPPCKVGYLNRIGWVGYWLDGVLFIKRFTQQPGARFPDGGCNTEAYCGDNFIEVETLGALTRLAPGEVVVHEETWEVFDSLDQEFIPASLRRRLQGS